MNQKFSMSLLAFGVKRFRIYEQIVFVIVWEKGRYWHIPSISNTPSIEHRTDTFSISDCLNVPSPILPAIEYRLFSKTIIRCDTNVPFIVWNNANSPRGLGTIWCICTCFWLNLFLNLLLPATVSSVRGVSAKLDPHFRPQHCVSLRNYRQTSCKYCQICNIVRQFVNFLGCSWTILVVLGS